MLQILLKNLNHLLLKNHLQIHLGHPSQLLEFLLSIKPRSSNLYNPIGFDFGTVFPSLLSKLCDFGILIVLEPLSPTMNIFPGTNPIILELKTLSPTITPWL